MNIDKRTKKLIMAAAALVVLIGVYFVTLDLSPAASLQIDEPPELAMIIERAEGVRVSAFHMDNGYDLRFIRDLSDSDNEIGTWRLDDFRDFRLDQISVATVAFSVTNLPSHGAVSLADLAGNLELYGLGALAARLTIDYTDGSRAVLHVGHETPDGRFFYAMLEGADYVHFIEARTGRRMFFGHNNFMDKNLPRPDLLRLVEIQFSFGREEFGFDIAPPTGVEHFGWMRDEFISYGVGAGKRLDMSFAFAALFEPLPGLRLAGVIINPDENMEVYGLSEPFLQMNLVDEDGVVLYFDVGGEAGDGLRYIKLQGEPFVFTIDAGVMERIEGVNRSRLFQRRLTDVITTQAETVRLRGTGHDVTIHPNRDNADALAYRTIFETRWDAYITPFDVSGVPAVWTMDIDGHILREDIVERQLDNITEGNFTHQADGSIRYSLTYTFHVLDDLFYAISRDGEPAVTAISRNVLDRVFSAVE